MGAPANMDAYSEQIMALLNALKNHARNHAYGGNVSNGGTTQSSGASTAPNFDVDVAEIDELVVNGVWHGALAAGTDIDSDAGDGVDFGATSGKSVIFAVVAETGADNDTPDHFALAGDVADTGAEVAPTDAEITTALSHSNWVRLANVTVARTGDTAVTVTVDENVRVPAAAVATDFPVQDTD